MVIHLREAKYFNVHIKPCVWLDLDCILLTVDEITRGRGPNQLSGANNCSGALEQSM